MNTYLKIIADTFGIKKRVTVHGGRHFFSVNFLDKGGDVYVLSKLLGHTSIKTTSIYAKVSNPRMDQEMKKVFG